MHRLSALPVVLALCIFILPSSARAAERAGVTLPDAVQVDGDTLVLNGLALRSVFVFDVYVAGLYLPERDSDAEDILLRDAPRHLVMHFVRDVDKEDLDKGWRKGLKKNTPEASPGLVTAFDRLCGMMGNIKDGEEITFTYRPGQGTEVLFAGQAVGMEPGKEFADALWRCWIGPDPDPGRSFRDALLGKD